MSDATITIRCGAINVSMPLAELEEVRPGYLVHRTETRGVQCVPIVVRSRDLTVLDPDDEGRFRIGRKLMTFDEILEAPKKKSKKADEEE